MSEEENKSICVKCGESFSDVKGVKNCPNCGEPIIRMVSFPPKFPKDDEEIEIEEAEEEENEDDGLTPDEPTIDKEGLWPESEKTQETEPAKPKLILSSERGGLKNLTNDSLPLEESIEPETKTVPDSGSNGILPPDSPWRDNKKVPKKPLEAPASIQLEPLPAPAITEPVAPEIKTFPRPDDSVNPAVPAVPKKPDEVVNPKDKTRVGPPDPPTSQNELKNLMLNQLGSLKKAVKEPTPVKETEKMAADLGFKEVKQEEPATTGKDYNSLIIDRLSYLDQKIGKAWSTVIKRYAASVGDSDKIDEVIAKQLGYLKAIKRIIKIEKMSDEYSNKFLLEYYDPITETVEDVLDKIIAGDPLTKEEQDRLNKLEPFSKASGLEQKIEKGQAEPKVTSADYEPSKKGYKPEIAKVNRDVAEKMKEFTVLTKQVNSGSISNYDEITEKISKIINYFKQVGVEVDTTNLPIDALMKNAIEIGEDMLKKINIKRKEIQTEFGAINESLDEMLNYIKENAEDTYKNSQK